VTARGDVTEIANARAAGSAGGVFHPMLFPNDRCQLITGERSARNTQLSTANGDITGDLRMIAAKQ
jgi:hypothetical protein